jgi:hypothetical protein
LRRCSGGNAGHHKGPRKPLAPPGAPFSLRGDGKGTGGAHAVPKNRAAERWLCHSGASPKARSRASATHSGREPGINYHEQRGRNADSDTDIIAVLDSELLASLGPRNDQSDRLRPFAQPFQFTRALLALRVSVRATNRALNLGENALAAPTSRQTDSQTLSAGKNLNLPAARCGQTDAGAAGHAAFGRQQSRIKRSAFGCVCCVA